MAQLEPISNQLQASGAQLVYIAAEKRAAMWNPERFLERQPVAFPFLLDEDRAVTKAYGLHHRIGMDGINIARPATLVIDGKRVVRYIYRGEHQRDRAPVEEVMGAVEKVAAE